jgi:hypothetical protein
MDGKSKINLYFIFIPNIKERRDSSIHLFLNSHIVLTFLSIQYIYYMIIWTYGPCLYKLEQHTSSDNTTVRSSITKYIETDDSRCTNLQATNHLGDCATSCMLVASHEHI